MTHIQSLSHAITHPANRPPCERRNNAYIKRRHRIYYGQGVARAGQCIADPPRGSKAETLTMTCPGSRLFPRRASEMSHPAIKQLPSHVYATLDTRRQLTLMSVGRHRAAGPLSASCRFRRPAPADRANESPRFADKTRYKWHIISHLSLARTMRRRGPPPASTLPSAIDKLSCLPFGITNRD